MVLSDSSSLDLYGELCRRDVLGSREAAVVPCQLVPDEPFREFSVSAEFGDRAPERTAPLLSFATALKLVQ